MRGRKREREKKNRYTESREECIGYRASIAKLPPGSLPYITKKPPRQLSLSLRSILGYFCPVRPGSKKTAGSSAPKIKNKKLITKTKRQTTRETQEWGFKPWLAEREI